MRLRQGQLCREFWKTRSHAWRGDTPCTRMRDTSVTRAPLRRLERCHCWCGRKPQGPAKLGDGANRSVGCLNRVEYERIDCFLWMLWCLRAPRASQGNLLAPLTGVVILSKNHVFVLAGDAHGRSMRPRSTMSHSPDPLDEVEQKRMPIVSWVLREGAWSTF